MLNSAKAVNIGAGSVTANFDGQAVQKTEIDDGVSVGAGCVLIAPLKLGVGAKDRCRGGGYARCCRWRIGF